MSHEPSSAEPTRDPLSLQDLQVRRASTSGLAAAEEGLGHARYRRSSQQQHGHTSNPRQGLGGGTDNSLDSDLSGTELASVSMLKARRRGSKSSDGTWKWTRSDGIAAASLVLTIILGISAMVPQNSETKAANAIAQRSEEHAAEANRIAMYAACQDESVANTSYCVSILASGPGALPRPDVSAQDMDVGRFAAFEDVLRPLLERRLGLGQNLTVLASGLNVSNTNATAKDNFRHIAQSILDNEREIAGLLGLRTTADEIAYCNCTRPVEDDKGDGYVVKYPVYNTVVSVFGIIFAAFMLSALLGMRREEFGCCVFLALPVGLAFTIVVIVGWVTGKLDLGS